MRRMGKKKLDLVGAAGMRKLPLGSSPGRLRRGPIHVPAWSRLGGACLEARGAVGVWVTEPGALGGRAIRPAAVYALDVGLCDAWWAAVPCGAGAAGPCPRPAIYPWSG